MMTLFRPSSLWVEIDSEGVLLFITNVIETRLVLFIPCFPLLVFGIFVTLVAWNKEQGDD